MTCSAAVIDTGEDRLHVVTNGSGSPPLVLTSGLGGAWYDWLPLLPHLSPRPRVVCFDRPGLGKSPTHRVLPSLDGEVERLAGVVRRFAGQAAVVVAHSLAGAHAEAFARRYPNSLRGLVLVDPSCDPVRETRSPALTRLAATSGWALASLSDRSGVSARVGPALFSAAIRAVCTRRVPDEVDIAGRAVFSSARPAAAAWCEQLTYQAVLNDLARLRKETDFPSIPTRILTACGELRGAAANGWIRRHEWLATELGARHRLFPENGHFLAWESPAAVATAVHNALEEST